MTNQIWGHTVKLSKAGLIILIILIVVGTFPEGYSQTENKASIIVEINPNLELFAVVYILAFNESDPFIIAPEGYVNDVLTYFAPYKEHEAVEYIRKILDKSYPYYHRDSVIMDLSTRLVALDYLPNETNLGDLKPLAEFAKESNFMEFYKAHEKEYYSYVPNITQYLKILPKMHEKFFGYTYHEYRVELSYSLRIHPHSKFQEEKIYSIGYVYSRGYNTDVMFRQLITIFHEFTHPFVNAFLGKTYGLFEDKNYYLHELKNRLPTLTAHDPEHFGSFERYLNELLTESLAEYIALKSGIPQDLVTFRTLQMATVLYPIQDFLGEYEIFEKIRKENETLFEYAPIMAEHMGKWATPENISKYFKMKTPITVVEAEERIYYVGRVIIVYGTQNPDKSGVEYDKETAYMLKEMYEKGFRAYYGASPSIFVKSDVNLTSEDFKENLILIGGPVANKITRELNTKLPIIFIYNKSWEVKRNPTAVHEFHAFLVSSDSIMELSLNSTTRAIGVSQVVRNPWNEDNFIIVIEGVDRYGTRRMLEEFSGLRSYTIIGESYREMGFYMTG